MVAVGACQLRQHGWVQVRHLRWRQYGTRTSRASCTGHMNTMNATKVIVVLCIQMKHQNRVLCRWVVAQWQVLCLNLQAILMLLSV